MTREEGIILSAYTGYLLVDSFDPVHKFIEDLLGRPVWTHEFADRALLKEIREKCRPLLPAVKEEPRWIPVTERLPAEEKRVLVYRMDAVDMYTEIDTDLLRKGKWVRWGRDVTHWMPLPDRPEEPKEGKHGNL